MLLCFIISRQCNRFFLGLGVTIRSVRRLPTVLWVTLVWDIKLFFFFFPSGGTLSKSLPTLGDASKLLAGLPLSGLVTELSTKPLQPTSAVVPAPFPVLRCCLLALAQLFCFRLLHIQCLTMRFRAGIRSSSGRGDFWREGELLAKICFHFPISVCVQRA